MKASLKPSIGKTKNIRGRVTGFFARFASIRTEGATKQEAAEACEQEVRAALDRLEEGTKIETWRDHVFIVFPDIGGWRYWLDIFTPSGSSHPYSVQCPGDRFKARNAALFHLAQTIWHRHVNDTVFVEGLPDAVKAELLPYFCWQRAYAEAADAGANDTQARLAADAARNSFKVVA